MANLGIDAATWTVLNRLLDEALDLPPAERAGWLATLAPEHHPLKERLADLLARVPDSSRLTLPKLGFTNTGAAVALVAAAEKPGDVVGPYRLGRKLGDGGMGTVWLADRTDGLIDRPVALKLPRGSWQRPELAARMARERRILASLNHPHIARLYDAGLTEAGVPFLALEYVEGLRLDEYCRTHQLAVAARLRLFLQVTQAVVHAHARLVVHRDLKPSNILVTTDGQVRLLDFGIAGLLEDGRAQHSELTQAAGGPALTLVYASPEQIQGAPLGVASDVYSLGVVLCELLTGQRPYRLERDTRGALEEAIVRAEPARPSALAADAVVRRALRGDLDTIILKALKKNPDERYVTVQALADDLERHLQGFAVRARPESRSYRFAKFVRRHRVGVFAAAAVLAALVTGAAVAFAQARIARAEQHRAEEVKDFIASIFRDADPYGSSGHVPNVVELLVRAREKIDRSLAGRPELRVELLNLVGWSLHNMQEIDGAESAARAALEQGRRFLPPGHPQMLRARLLELYADRMRGRTALMGPGLDALIPLLRRARETDGDLVLALKLRAHRAIDEGEFAVAITAAQEAHAAARSLTGASPNDIAETTLLLALSYQYAGESALAVSTAEEAMRAAREIDPGNPRHPQVIEAHMTLGRALESAGDLERAAQEMGRGLDGALAVFGATNLMVGFFSQNLARCQLDLGEIRAAAENSARAVQIIENSVEHESYTYGAVVGTRGRAWLAARQPERALPDLVLAAATLARANGPAHERTLSAQRSLALGLAWLGRGDEAEAVLADVAKLAPHDTDAARTRHVLGVVRRLAGRPDEAWRLQQQALTNIPDEPATRRERLRVLLEIGVVSSERHPPDSAVEVLPQALATWAELHLRPTPERADALVALGRALLAAGRNDEALANLAEADAFWREFDPENRGAGEAAWWLARVCDALGRAAEAQMVRARAEAILARSPVPRDAALLRAR